MFGFDTDAVMLGEDPANVAPGPLTLNDTITPSARLSKDGVEITRQPTADSIDAVKFIMPIGVLIERWTDRSMVNAKAGNFTVEIDLPTVTVKGVRIVSSMTKWSALVSVIS